MALKNNTNLFQINENYSSHYKIKFNSLNFISTYIIVLFWLTAFAPLVLAVIANLFSNETSYIVKVTIQITYITILFLIYYLLPKNNKKIFIYLFLASIFISLFQITRDGLNIETFLHLLHGIKVYFVPLFYFFLVYYLLKNNNDFVLKFEKNIHYLFFFTLIVSVFELLSSNFFPNILFNYLISLSPVIPVEAYGRPNGLLLESHSAAFVLSIASLFYFIKGRQVLSILFMSVVILSAIKTWSVGYNFALLLYAIYNYKNIVVFKNYIILLFSQIVVLYIFSTVLKTYVYHMNPNISSGTRTMLDLYTSFDSYQLLSISPNGFFFGNTILNDVYSLFILYQFGIVLGLFYFLILFKKFTLNNQFWPIVIFAMFAIIHTFPLNFLFIMMIFSYFLHYPYFKKGNACH